MPRPSLVTQGHYGALRELRKQELREKLSKLKRQELIDTLMQLYDDYVLMRAALLQIKEAVASTETKNNEA